jgi:SAM-dependent methyltransferase
MTRPDRTLLPLASGLNAQKYYPNSLRIGQAYHDLPFKDFHLAAWRTDTLARASLIAGVSHIVGKAGLDLGCSIGGMSFALQMSGASMTGVDFNKEDIQFAREVERHYRTGAKFRCADIDQVIWGSDFLGRYDFVVWLSQWMWYFKQVGKERSLLALRRVSQHIRVLWFEVSVGDGCAGIDMLKLGLSSAKDVRALLETWTEFRQIEVFEQDRDGLTLRRPLCYASR